MNVFFNYTITESKDCTGCYACQSICPMKSIHMKESKGHCYPIIDMNTCTKCQKCRQICPTNRIIKQQQPQKVYAAQILDDGIRKISSSGGIFSALSNLILLDGGVVAGAKSDSALTVEHITVDSIGELGKLRGSKYIQSDINNIFLEVRTMLVQGKIVLFSGTPCQIAGLSGVVEDIDKSNLLLVEIACHGVISKKVLESYIKEAGLFPEKTVVDYRSKDTGWNKFSILIRDEITYSRGIFGDTDFGRAFNANLLFRPSCYRCKFKVCSSLADITIGDFWGIEKCKPNFEDGLGTSVVFIHTEKGKMKFEKIKPRIRMEEVRFDDAIRSNKYLYEPIKCEYNMKKVQNLFENKGLSMMVKKYGKARFFTKVIAKMKRILTLNYHVFRN